MCEGLWRDPPTARERRPRFSLAMIMRGLFLPRERKVVRQRVAGSVGCRRTVKSERASLVGGWEGLWRDPSEMARETATILAGDEDAKASVPRERELVWRVGTGARLTAEDLGWTRRSGEAEKKNNEDVTGKVVDVEVCLIWHRLTQQSATLAIEDSPCPSCQSLSPIHSTAWILLGLTGPGPVIHCL